MPEISFFLILIIMKSTKIAIAVILGLCFVLAAAAVGFSYYQTKKPEKTVSVVGLAEKDFTSDLIVWNLRYDATAANMKDAYSSLKEKNKIVKEFLKSQGINDSEMDFMNITTERQYEYEWDNVNRRSVEIFRGYNSEQRVRIESKDVDKIEKAIRAIAQLYDQSIQINSDSPEYYYTKLGDLKMEMLSQASKNARERAEAVTSSAGGKLGGLKTATTGVFQITAPNSSEDSYSWGGAFNTSSKQKHVSINMRLTYYVK